MFDALQHDETLDELTGLGPVIPVLQFNGAEEAVNVCKALCEGGVRVFEITLRTAAGLAAIEAVAKLGDDFRVGVGTIRQPRQLQDAFQAGARFAVSPGFTPVLAEAAQAIQLPLIPGVMTPSEILQAQTAGYSRLKFFPAETAGGVPMLKALAGPFPDLRFMPTGGITPENARTYLAMPQVSCVGGSWLAPRPRIEAKDWKGIAALAQAASALRGR